MPSGPCVQSKMITKEHEFFCSDIQWTVKVRTPPNTGTEPTFKLFYLYRI